MTDLTDAIKGAREDDPASLSRLVRELTRRGHIEKPRYTDQMLRDTMAEVQATASRIAGDVGLARVELCPEIHERFSDDLLTIKVFVISYKAWAAFDGIERMEHGELWLSDAIDEEKLFLMLALHAREHAHEEAKEIIRRDQRASWSITGEVTS